MNKDGANVVDVLQSHTILPHYQSLHLTKGFPVEYFFNIKYIEYKRTKNTYYIIHYLLTNSWLRGLLRGRGQS